MAAIPLRTFQQDPNAILDYAVDWSEWLGSDVISSVVWTLTAGLTQGAVAASSQMAIVWLSGGVAGTNYVVTCRVLTAGGRTDERSFQVNVVDR